MYYFELHVHLSLGVVKAIQVGVNDRWAFADRQA